MSNLPHSTPLTPLFSFLEYTLSSAQDTFTKLPGSAVIQRYVRSSHQNDPGRTILELILIVFAIRTLLQSRTRAADRNGKHFIVFSDKEIDELVDEWTPEPLAPPLTPTEASDLAAVPIIVGPNGPKPKIAILNSAPAASNASSSTTLLSSSTVGVSSGPVQNIVSPATALASAATKTVVNFASFNFAGLAGNDHIKQRAIETLRKYGLGSCGPPGFYGTLDVHMDLENDISEFLGTESTILYSQSFATVSSVIPAFCKRGDIIVADRGVNFGIQKGIQISRSTVRWFEHNDLSSLEEVLIGIEKDRKKRRGALTRRFIITEGIFARDGNMVDLPKLIELKIKYKHRLILDESLSFGAVGRTGRGLTELYNVPASKVDMLLGSLATGLASAGGFCSGSQTVIEHQRINGPSFVFSASMPALLAVSASEAINIFRDTPRIFENLQENVRAARSVLEKIEGLAIVSHPVSPAIFVCLKGSTAPVANVQGGFLMPPPMASTPSSSSAASSSSRRHSSSGLSAAQYAHESRVLQEIVEECIAQGVLLTRAKQVPQEIGNGLGLSVEEPKPSIRIAVCSSLSKKEVEKSMGIIKSVVGKILGKKK